ncbi:MAG: IclR family transcriptional regulator [Desulfobacteraceae bacterium]
MGLKTVEKALDVFTCIAQENVPVSTTELSKKMGINQTTMSRLLNTLKNRDFLEQDASTRHYRLGPAMAEMARAVHRSLDGLVTKKAIPFIKSLRDMLGETIALEVISGHHIYHAYVADSLNPVSLRVAPGDRVMPHAHVGSKAIVAFSDSDMIDFWLSQNLPRYTNNTVTEPEQLRKSYEQILKNGIAYDYGEYIEEINAIGAPIFNHQNKPVAGIAIAVISLKKRKNWNQHYILQLKKTANAISSCLHSSRKI